MLTDRIQVLQASNVDTAEDIFSSSLTALFPDDTRNQHGDPDATVIYTSERFGDIKLTVADPAGEDNRKLFAHYLWNAAVYAAEELSKANAPNAWRVEHETVIELGAGLGLGGIISSLAGAKEVFITDYPAPELLMNIRRNVTFNLKDKAFLPPSVHGHTWGEVSDDFATTHAHSFTRVIAADCLWMPWEHGRLARSMIHFLSPAPAARVLVIAGFHTGRAKTAPFFDVASAEGMDVESIHEVDVGGNTRAWMKERDGGKENVTERKRWLVVAVLKLAQIRPS